MAKPKIDLVVWASQDVILPEAHGINKVKPIDDLLKKGYDKGEAPAAEEFNYILNMCTDYVRWLYEERLPAFEQEILALLEKFKAEILAALDELRQEMAQMEKALNDKIEALKQYLVPVGAVVQWHALTPPSGWLECNGQSFDPATNPRLYAALDNKNHVPDYRGYFPRGWAHGSANDPDSGRQLGSVQGDAIRNITGSFAADIAQTPLIGRYTDGVFYDAGGVGGGDEGYVGGEVRLYKLDASRQVPVAPENRPKNIAVMYIIKTDTAETTGGVTPTGITVSPESVDQLVGHTVQVSAQVMPISIAAQWPLSYTSLDTGIATVDQTGLVRLVGQGSTKIVVSISNGMMAQIPVISHTGLSSLTLTVTDAVIEGSSASVTVTRNPTASDEPLEWESSNTGVAVVNSAGQVTGVAKGTATVTARGKFTGITGSVSVTVQAKAVPAVVEDIRLAFRGILRPTDDTMWEVPDGAVLTGYSIGAANVGHMYYRYLQKRVGGVWYTVEYA